MIRRIIIKKDVWVYSKWWRPYVRLSLNAPQRHFVFKWLGAHFQCDIGKARMHLMPKEMLGGV
jgi:hypothetical protein